jgi:hypothetical protein
MIITDSESRALKRLFDRIRVEDRKDARMSAMDAELDALQQLEDRRDLKDRELNRKRWLDDKIDELDSRPPRVMETVFFANHPHLLMPLGFDEFRVIPRDDDDLEPKVRFSDIPNFEEFSFAFPYEVLFRETSSGTWFQLEGIGRLSGSATPDQPTIHFSGPKAPSKYILPVDYLNLVETIRREPDPNSRLLLFPGIWTPNAQSTQQIALTSIVPEILKAVFEEKSNLRDIHWRHLEEIVAELLKAFGMKVWVTPNTHDGGRDVIARGELIPGEPTLLAIEVKQKEVMGLADVQRALQANRDFPALLVATAGRFSAGVIREKLLVHNQLRLFLKDGVAVGQWIEKYARGRGWQKLSK